jgi:2-keto-3-deoxy-L-rhamnonate aldolase RhmA
MPPEARARLQEAQALGDELRRRYADGLVRGTFVIELPTTRAVRALALAGFDFVVLDLEHSPFDVGSLGALITEAQLCGIAALVRPPAFEHALVGKLLDLGANGLLIPHVDTVEDARAVVAAARYPPVGGRGACPLTGTAVYDVPNGKLDTAALVMLQIESREAVDDVAGIAAVPGVDGVFIGPYDLSHALGVPGDVNGDDVIGAADDVAAAAPPGVLLGVYVDAAAESQPWARRGYRFQCIEFDGRMLLEQARAKLRVASDDRKRVA